LKGLDRLRKYKEYTIAQARAPAASYRVRIKSARVLASY
jgi:hypothetical protein